MAFLRNEGKRYIFCHYFQPPLAECCLKLQHRIFSPCHDSIYVIVSGSEKKPNSPYDLTDMPSTANPEKLLLLCCHLSPTFRQHRCKVNTELSIRLFEFTETHSLF